MNILHMSVEGLFVPKSTVFINRIKYTHLYLNQTHVIKLNEEVTV